MSKHVELTILGEPMGKQRPRYSNYGGYVRTYTPQKTINYESLVVHEYNEKYGKLIFDKEEPVSAEIIAYFPLSKVDYGKKGLSKSGREKMSMVYCTKHLDLDNIVKIVLDSLNSICFFDDKQVVSVIAHKVWTTDTPRVEIKLESIRE
jgi:Holliday junction resolvase RusA-like endonuclease